MEIILTDEDIKQIEKDGYIAVLLENNGYCIMSMSAEFVKEWSEKE